MNFNVDLELSRCYMVKTFSLNEHNLIKLLCTQNSFVYEGHTYKVDFVGKPVTKYGEPKTDIFMTAIDINDKNRFLIRKISFKQPNYDFIENKISMSRAEEILGTGWSNILKNSLTELAPNFLSRKLIFKNSFGKTQAGSFTLGWKIEFLNKKSGELSLKMPLTRDQIIGIYSGLNASKSKRNAMINGRLIDDSGVADYILIGEKYNKIEDMLRNLIDIESYVDKYPSVFLACKALNYRSFEKKFDGNRPLGVYVDWNVKNNKLSSELKFDRPLEKAGKEVFDQLEQCLNYLSIYTTDDVSSFNTDDRIIFQ